MEKKGNIFNIQHFSIHDGPGTRTVVFFKGCNLSCKWCHNPESISPKRQILFYPEKCVGCLACIKNCPGKCHKVGENGAHIIDLSTCQRCFKCCEDCYAEALVAVGEEKDADYVMREILSNKPYFDYSGGGVTFSGGECMLQVDFLSELLKRSKEAGIHTAVDTAGNVPWERFEKILDDTDLFLYDIKAFEPERHKELTGVDNKRILENFEKLVASGKEVFVRIPCIPGSNDDQLPLISNYLEQFPQVTAELLPYHAMGNSKYIALGSKPQIDIPNMDKKVAARLKEKYHFI